MSTEDPIAHACRLLREAAADLQQNSTYSLRPDDWRGEPEAKAAFDEYMALADTLEAAAVQEPVATVFTMEALTPGAGVKYHATIHKPVPAGTKLYTHPKPAAQDAERIDWLERAGPTSICLVMDRQHDGEIEVSPDDGPTGYGKTLRAAIDAAIAAQQGDSHE